ncbi:MULTISPECIES: hypothetical protein [Priestia]|jgi:hypothetical protein|uniref:hypothetical protein n=1 Tax=Priestia TaxID=2800373 RepID=UPI0011A46EC0|nr:MULTISPECIES: hypothetical protein [Priestia]MBK0008759.1 hypothetical protein [Bacillus sp. S35]MCM3644029.1 hypothetical protein [Priestia aryabhattai]
MSITEIKKMLSTLIQYEDSIITHVIPGLIELVYSKGTQSFQLTTLIDGNMSPYDDIDSASEALYIILNPEGLLLL